MPLLWGSSDLLRMVELAAHDGSGSYYISSCDAEARSFSA